MARHEEYLELCAVSTSGSLSQAEKAKLAAHVATCPDCRKALREFQETAAIAGPLFAAEGSDQSKWEVDDAFERFRERVAEESAFGARHTPIPDESPSSNGYWTALWLSLAAMLVVSVALGLLAYRAGVGQGRESAKKAIAKEAAQVPKLEEEASDAGRDRQVLQAQLAERDKALDELRHSVAGKAEEVARLRQVAATQEKAASQSAAERQEWKETSAELSRKLEGAEASLQTIRSQLEAAEAQRDKDQETAKALEAQFDDLNRLLQERETTIDRQQGFLAKDRDIRELMGARDLYIAEVFDVANTGATKKPYGRVFYTKGKSLVFFAYDLDKQAGAREASTFQAWGRRGSDRTQSLNLGIFYEDSAAKKRWKLQFDDPRKLEQIDAVFVTVEPQGGSRLPSGKPLLFAYLKIDPNHP